MKLVKTLGRLLVAATLSLGAAAQAQITTVTLAVSGMT